MFLVVGIVLIGISEFAPRVPIEQLALAVAATAPVDVVAAAHRSPRKLTSALSLVLLLAVTILLLAVLFVAAVVGTFLLLSGH